MRFGRTVAVGLSVALVLSLPACTHHVKLDTNIVPRATVANQRRLSVGLFIPEEMRGYTVKDSADWSDKYQFDNLGQAISSSVTNAVRRVFRNVETLETYPTEVMMAERQLDLGDHADFGESLIHDL